MLLPLTDNEGQQFPAGHYETLRNELTQRFAGLTAYTRTPADGLWKPAAGEISHDEIVIFEVMVEAVDEAWWAAFRKELERRFKQSSIVIRTLEMRLL
jgi:hypothetical protein